MVFPQEKSGIDVYWRPLSKNASALVFFSRRHDMPYRYTTSLSKLNYTTGSYKVLRACGSFLFDGGPFLSVWLFPQIFDVFTNKAVALKDSTDFVVSVNPTGVVMWYVSAPATLSHRRFYTRAKFQGSTYNDENVIPLIPLVIL